VLSNGALDDGARNAVVVGAVVVTVTVTFTEVVPSSVTEDFESVHVAFAGAPAHVNCTVPVNPSIGAKVAL
jgi:hypothetical protein